jgi:hypothetical protein
VCLPLRHSAASVLTSTTACLPLVIAPDNIDRHHLELLLERPLRVPATKSALPAYVRGTGEWPVIVQPTASATLAIRGAGEEVMDLPGGWVGMLVTSVGSSLSN